MKPIRRHLTYANVMSSLAVFLLLGGAGAETVTKLIASAGVLFARHQDQWQLLYLLRTILGGYTPQQASDGSSSGRASP